jgi:very-short-patch-repair endonuclease
MVREVKQSYGQRFKSKKVLRSPVQPAICDRNYIVDFICRKIKLIIEIDGSSHQHKVEEDENRDARLEALGYRVLRVRQGEVLNDLNNVLRAIEAYLPEEVLNDQSP